MAKPGKEAVLKVNMHCQGCVATVSRCLRGFNGVEEVVIDRQNHKVIAKGANVDPLKVLERVRKKYNKTAELISPKIVPETKKLVPPKEKPPEIAIKITVLKMLMHCQGCAEDVRKKLFEMGGVLTVEPNMEQGTVTVKGVVESSQLVEHIRRKLRKNAQILSEKPVAVPDSKKKKAKGEKEEEKEKVSSKEVAVLQCPPPQYSDHDLCACQTFNDENVHSCLVM